MTDQEIETLYTINLATSHIAGLRGVFDAGFAAGLTAETGSPDPSVSLGRADVQVPMIDEP